MLFSSLAIWDLSSLFLFLGVTWTFEQTYWSLKEVSISLESILTRDKVDHSPLTLLPVPGALDYWPFSSTSLNTLANWDILNIYFM